MANPVQPGGFRLKRRRDSRKTIQDLGAFKITNLDEAALFVDIIVKKAPELKDVIAKARTNSAFANSRASVSRQRVMQPQVVTKPNSVPASTQDSAAEVKTLEPSAPTEAQRLAQLKAAQAPDASFQPVGEPRKAPQPVPVAPIEQAAPQAPAPLGTLADLGSEEAAPAEEVVTTAKKTKKGSYMFYQQVGDGKKSLVSPKKLTEAEKAAAIEAADRELEKAE